jgi:glutaredoxin
VDKSGNVHYGDEPSAEAAKVEQKKFGGASAAEDADLPYATRHARQNFPVTLYVFSDCGEPCQQARTLLNKRGVPFAEKNLKTKEDIDAFKLKSGSESAPTLSVGSSWLKGFETGQWNSELDNAGYPKTASYRTQSPSTSSSKPAAKIEQSR